MEYARSITHLSNQLFHPKDFLLESLGMTAQPPSHDGTFVQITLEGAGFDGAKIPLGSSEELIRYKNLLVAAAKARWQKKHPDEEVSDELDEAAQLSLAEIIDGAAMSVPPRPTENTNQEIDEFLELGRKDLDEFIDLVIRGALDPADFPDWADDDNFWDLGKSLRDGETMRIAHSARRSSSTTTRTLRIRNDFIKPLKREVKGQPTESFQLLEGKVTGLNLTKKRFQFETDELGEVQGSYKSPVMPADLIELLCDSANAETFPQPALILGRLSFRKEHRHAIVETTFVARSNDRFVPAAKKLASLSELEDGWSDEGSLRPQSKTLALAGAVLSIIREVGLTPPPGIFPTEEGGVLFEWATANYVFSIEVESDNNIVAYALYPQQREGRSVEGDSPAFLTRIIEDWVPAISG